MELQVCTGVQHHVTWPSVAVSAVRVHVAPGSVQFVRFGFDPVLSVLRLLGGGALLPPPLGPPVLEPDLQDQNQNCGLEARGFQEQSWEEQDKNRVEKKPSFRKINILNSFIF